jgi:hypothetical protein
MENNKNSEYGQTGRNPHNISESAINDNESENAVQTNKTLQPREDDLDKNTANDPDNPGVTDLNDNDRETRTPGL